MIYSLSPIFKNKDSHRCLRLTTYAIFALIISSSSAWGQQKSPVNIYQEASGNGGFHYYAQNQDFSPYQIQIDFTELNNLQANQDLPFYQVIYPGQPQRLFTLNPKDQAGTSFRSKYQIAIGDPDANIDMGFAYLLPFEDGKNYLLIQGSNGAYTHQGKNAWDFVMDEGTNVCASRKGIVVSVKEDSDVGGPDVSFMEFANRITVLHDDGSFADYVHLRQGGALVNPGDRIEAGQVIGHSGNTGWSTKPHLHFQVYKAIKFGVQTLPVKFLLEQGLTARLEELKEYRGYHPE